MLPIFAILPGLADVVGAVMDNKREGAMVGIVQSSPTVDFDNNDELSEFVYDVSVEKLPEVISSKINAISALENKIRSSEVSANKAMDYVHRQMRHYTLKGWGIFEHRKGNTKDIIEDTQEAVKKLADANEVNVEALKESFIFQKKLADTTKYLFKLGCANIAMNRIAVREIELRLSEASEEEISELARQELMAVVGELKLQEDMLAKIEFLTSTVKELENEISIIKNDYTDRISDNEEKLNKLEKNKKKQDEINKELLERNEKILVEFRNSKKNNLGIIILSSSALICGAISIVLQLIK